MCVFYWPPYAAGWLASSMGAQVINGIGFLGAGTIITDRKQGLRVRGLTTAAGLRASACMGLAVGIGFYEGAVIMVILLMLVIVAMNHLDEVYVKSSTPVQLYLELHQDTPMSAVLETLDPQCWHMSSFQRQEDNANRAVFLLDVQHDGKPQPPSPTASPRLVGGRCPLGQRTLETVPKGLNFYLDSSFSTMLRWLLGSAALRPGRYS